MKHNVKNFIDNQLFINNKYELINHIITFLHLLISFFQILSQKYLDLIVVIQVRSIIF